MVAVGGQKSSQAFSSRLCRSSVCWRMYSYLEHGCRAARVSECTYVRMCIFGNFNTWDEPRWPVTAKITDGVCSC